MIKKVLLYAFALCIFSLAQAQEDEKVNKMTEFEASYISDFGSVLSGGIEQSNFYLGMVDISMTLTPWENGEFYLQYENTHGETPSENFVGDLHVFSNINNGNFSYLYMAWYKHTFNNLSITLGVHDLNSEFVATEYGGLFCNSSFGIQPSAAWNLPVPIFPKNALGIILKYDISENFTFQTAVYDGDPLSLDDDKYGLDYGIDFKNQGIVSFSEMHYNKLKNGELNGTYKLGFQYHSADFTNMSDNSVQKGNYGFYAIGDQSISEKLGAFVQLGWTPEKLNINPVYAGGGFNYSGIGKRTNDVLGLAFAYGSVSSQFAGFDYNHETVIELTYSLQVSDNMVFKPDLQYIINPGAINGVNNAFIGFVRFSLSF